MNIWGLSYILLIFYQIEKKKLRCVAPSFWETPPPFPAFPTGGGDWVRIMAMIIMYKYIAGAMDGKKVSYDTFSAKLVLAVENEIIK